MFSVVVPLYNKERSIKSTIQSVLDQTFSDFEVIIVDDGSTDNSVSVVQNIEDTRIRIVRQENSGVSAARNVGVREAINNWIAFLDGDDRWEPNHLSQVIKMMNLFPDERVYATSFKYSDHRFIYKHYRSSFIFRIENYFKDVLKERLIWTSATVIHRKCFNEGFYFNEKINRGEDLDLWARLAKNFDIIKSEEVTAIYMVCSENKLTQKRSIYTKSILSIIDLKGLEGFERIYYKKMLFKRLKLDFFTFDLFEVLKILLKHNIELLR